MNKHMQKELIMLMRKNRGRCSICKQHYSDNDVVFTCNGYDKRHKLQTTTKCCRHKLVQILHIGVCGPVASEEVDEVMKDHPLHDEFF